MAIKHTFVSAKADGTDTSLVKPSDWNAEHTVEAGTIDTILPDQTGNNGKYLQTDGSASSWQTVTGSGTAADTVGDETTFGVAKDAGLATTYSRGDHTHGTPANPVDDGTNKIVVNGTTWEFWVNSVRVAILDASGNLRIKGIIQTEDVDV